MAKISSRKRVKVTLACIVCRKKKVKCDGVQPSCSRCQSNGVECQYTDPPKKRGPPKVRIEVIENRKHRIESLLLQQQKYNSLDYTQSFDIPVNTLLCLIAEEVQRKKINGSNDMLSDFHHDHFPDTWSEFYFDHFNYMFPLLSKDHFNKKDQEPLLKYATCALGALYASSDHHSLLFQRAQSILHDSATHCALSTVQALIIMCWYTHLTGDLQQCDLLRRQLAHMIDWLQFIQDDTPFTLESKRRAYWVAWVIDQWLTSCTLGERMLKEWQYPWPQLEDNQLNDPFLSSPSLSSTDDNHNTIQAFHQMIKLSIILKDIHQGNMSLQTLETNLTEWLLHLPSYLDYTKTSSAMTKLYRILYYTVQMVLYQRHQHHLSHSICITAANTILYITEQMMDTDQTVYTFNLFFLSLTFATSFIYLNSIISSSKHIHLLKQANPTSLSAFELEQLVQHYLDPTPPIEFHVDQLLSFLDNESSTTITSTDSSYFSPTHSPSLKEEFIFDPLTVVTSSSTLFF